MFKPRPGARAAKTVGNYALQIDFTDGHTAGIFSYDYLRSHLPLPAMRFIVSQRSLVRLRTTCHNRHAVGWTDSD